MSFNAVVCNKCGQGHASGAPCGCTPRGVGRPPGSFGTNNRVKDTITLHRDKWDKLDSIGPSRGKAVDKLLEGYEVWNIVDKEDLIDSIDLAIDGLNRVKEYTDRNVHIHMFQNHNWSIFIPNNVDSLTQFLKKVNNSPQLLWK